MALKHYYNFIFVLISFNSIANIAEGSNKPKIFAKYETIIKAGENHTVLCRSTEPITWKIPEVADQYKSWTDIEIVNDKLNNTDLNYISKLVIYNITFPYVGFYYCHTENADFSDTTKSSKIYLFVQDDVQLSVIDTEIETVIVTQYETAVLPCRPTSPDVTVELTLISGEKKDNATYDPKIGFSFFVTDLNEQGEFLCQFSREDNMFETLIYLKILSIIDSIATPIIKEISGGHTVVGEQLLLECQVKSSGTVDIVWSTPKGEPNTNRITITKMKGISDTGIIYQQLIINETILEDNGLYYCNASDRQKHFSYSNITIKIFDVNEHFINLTEEYGLYSINVKAGEPKVQWRIIVNGHPVPKLTWLNNANQIITNSTANKYIVNFSNKEAILKIQDIAFSDSGIYTLIAENRFENKSLNLFLNVTDKPTVQIKIDKFHFINSPSTIECAVAASPKPDVYWYYKPCQNNSCNFEWKPENRSENEGSQFISYIILNNTYSGEIQCYANNSLGDDVATEKVNVTDVVGGFDIFGIDSTIERINESNTIVIAKGEPISLTCGAVLDDENDQIEWFLNNSLIANNDRYYTERSHTQYTNRVTLRMSEVDILDSGIYSCKISRESDNFRNINMIVTSPYAPSLNKTNLIQNIEMNLPQRLELFCKFSGIPKPTIEWYKNNEILQTHDRIKLMNGNQNIRFTYTDVKDEGSYKCKASNKIGSASKEINLKFKNKTKEFTIWYIVIIVILLICVILTGIYIICKIRKEKLLQKELQKVGLENFDKGGIENLNPDLGVDEQAELLPYDKKWEFPISQLKLGKQLGSGAFGIVMKGEAKGIVVGESFTTVAVKMVKRNADDTHIRALASELKIMVHLGKHVNVVNLLGACTKNVAKRELLVIVEFCRYGNLHNYLLRHRDKFINQVDLNTGNIDYSIGIDILERTYSGSKSDPNSPFFKNAALSFSNSGEGTVVHNNMVDYRDDDEMLTSNNSEQILWLSNYKGDYKGTVKPICTNDLVVWAFQVARGMEYLASRKVLHGDLAARNILLSDNNIVKICDFGLAKSMYKNDNYKKSGSGLLPVKWLAIESIRDRIFSTQSDVWSFGIVLWEFFSLARTPYPGIEAGERLYNKLVEGYRMECPEFAPNEMYKMMTDCWQSKPLSRPSFTELAERIGLMLEDKDRKHYIDLNDPYLVMNTQRLEEYKSDYLAMLSPPNFENLSSPHYYVNDLPSTENTPGYLCMQSANIFSPRIEDNNIFDFELDKRKIPNNTCIEGNGNELLPMLLMKNESDGESSNCNSPRSPNSFSNPSYHVPPTIYSYNNSNKASKDILKSSDNYVNMPENKTALRENNSNNPFIKQQNGEKSIHQVQDNSMAWESTKV